MSQANEAPDMGYCDGDAEGRLHRRMMREVAKRHQITEEQLEDALLDLTHADDEEREALLAAVKPLVTDEGYADLTFYPLEDLRKEVEAIKKFTPDGTIGH